MTIFKGQYKVGEHHVIYMYVCNNMCILGRGRERGGRAAEKIYFNNACSEERTKLSRDILWL